MALAQEKVGKGSVPIDDAGHALHFALLGGSPGGLGDPAKFEQIAARGATLQHKFVTDKNAASYTGPCAKAFPETQASAFKALPPDVRDTRVMCYQLSTVRSDERRVGKGCVSTCKLRWSPDNLTQ